MRRLMLALLACLLFAVPAVAQNSVSVGQAFQIAADHDGANVTSFRLLRNGQVVDTKPVSALVNKVIVFDQPTSLAAGSYSYEIEVVGPGGSAKSAPPFVVDVKPLAPVPPKNIRLILVGSIQADGSVTFRIESVTVDK